MRRFFLFGLVFSLLSFQLVWAGHRSSSVHAAVIVCPSCHFQNAYSSSYCGHCGVLLSVQSSGLPCSYCSFVNASGASFCAGCGRSLAAEQEVYVVCNHCKKKYRAHESGCPSCSHNSLVQTPTVYTPVVSTPVVSTPTLTSPGMTNSHSRTHPGYFPGATSGCIQLDHFHKDDFNKVRKEYDISGYTGSSSFSRLIVDVTVNEKFAVILNTIHVRVKGKWQETTLGSRLNAGRNEFSVNIPQGATGVVCSFTHGRGSDVSVSIEN